MKFSWRKLPHPHYGNYGGRTNKGNGKAPIDWMDNLFKDHDYDLKYCKNKKQKLQADKFLLFGLVLNRNRKLKKPIYGSLYLWGTILIFSISVKVRSL